MVGELDPPTPKVAKESKDADVGGGELRGGEEDIGEAMLEVEATARRFGVEDDPERLSEV